MLVFEAIYICHYSIPSTYKPSNNPNETLSLYTKNFVIKSYHDYLLFNEIMHMGYSINGSEVSAPKKCFDPSIESGCTSTKPQSNQI